MTQGQEGSSQAGERLRGEFATDKCILSVISLLGHMTVSGSRCYRLPLIVRKLRPRKVI